MPFCDSRDVHELRYVSRLAELNVVSPFTGDITRAYGNEIINDDFSLSLNSSLMRLDFANYIFTNRAPDSFFDVNLFTINRNTEADMIHYMRGLGRDSITSIFTSPFIESYEFPFWEDSVSDIRVNSVVDSRLFIERKIEGLYLVMKKVVHMFKDEFTLSETYLIKGTMSEIVQRWGTHSYDLAKRFDANNEGGEYARFPTPFSYSRTPISPSGHLMRTIIRYEKGEVSLFMFIDKLINNHYYTAHYRTRKTHFDESVFIEHDEFKDLKAEYGQIEMDVKNLWHSKREIKAAIKAVEHLGCSRKYDKLYV